MNQIKTNTLFRIQELFVNKGWEINDGNGNSLSLYNRYCERIRLFNEEQQLLIIELTYNYTRIDLAIYLERFYESLIVLGDSIFTSFDKIFVYPLLSPSKSTPSKTKSAGFLHYMFEADDYTWLGYNFIPSSSIKDLQNKFNNSDSLLILIDDYVGSGDTAIDVCSEYLSIETKDGKINLNNIKVVSIAAQKQGITAVKNSLDIDVISAMVFDKGISDRFTGFEKTDKIRLMSEVEAIIEVKNDFQFGFKQSEALITMMHKTPNNTFPVYWLETRNKVAPFPRKKNYFKHG